MDFQNSIPNLLPPSPIDSYFPTPLRKESNLHINTGNNSLWKAQTSLFSPPLSPTSCDRSSRSNGSKQSKGQQQQPQQQLQQQQPQQQPQQPLNLWHANLQQVDIDTLTLENAKLQRANRLLKVDREDWLEKRVKPLEQHIRELTMSHVRWQRAAKLLQQDLEEAQQQLADWKFDQIIRLSSGGMGPEYQFLVDMIHQLQSQISSQTSCNGKSDNKSIIDTMDGKDYTELSVLVDRIHQLEQDLDTARQQLCLREKEVFQYKSELSTKDQLVNQLEKDFGEMNSQLHSFQHMLEEGGILTQTSDYATPTIKSTTVEMQMMLSATSRTRNKRKMGGNKESKNDEGDDDEDPLITSTVKDNAQGDDTILDLEKCRNVFTDGSTSSSDEDDDLEEDGECQNDGVTFDKAAYDLPPATINQRSSTPDIQTSNTKSNHRRTVSSSIYSSTSTRVQSWNDIGSRWNLGTVTAPLEPTKKPTTLVTFSSYPLTSISSMQPSTSIFTVDTNALVPMPGSYATTSPSPSSSSSATNDDSLQLGSTTDEQLDHLNDGISGSTGKQVVLSMFVGQEPFAPFVLMASFLGFSSTIGIDHDWLVPITLMALFSGYLWRGGFFGIRIKVNFQDN